VRAHDVIPVAERLGLVRMLDHRVLELLVSEMVAVPTLAASLNVSPSSTTDPDWWSALEAMLRASTGVAERLTIEITEMSAIQDIDDTRGFVSRVSAAGSRSTILARATPRSATCASSVSTSSRSTAPTCRT